MRLQKLQMDAHSYGSDFASSMIAAIQGKMNNIKVQKDRVSKHLFTLFFVEVRHVQHAEVVFERTRVVGTRARVDGDCAQREADVLLGSRVLELVQRVQK